MKNDFWLASDADGQTFMFNEEPRYEDGVWVSDVIFSAVDVSDIVTLPPGTKVHMRCDDDEGKNT